MWTILFSRSKFVELFLHFFLSPNYILKLKIYVSYIRDVFHRKTLRVQSNGRPLTLRLNTRGRRHLNSDVECTPTLREPPGRIYYAFSETLATKESAAGIWTSN